MWDETDLVDGFLLTDLILLTSFDSAFSGVWFAFVIHVVHKNKHSINYSRSKFTYVKVIALLPFTHRIVT